MKLNLIKVSDYHYASTNTNSSEINSYLDNKGKTFVDNYDILSIHMAKELSELVLRDLIIGEMSKFNIEENRSHIVTVTLGNDVYKFNIVRFDSEGLGQGYNISKTLLT